MIGVEIEDETETDEYGDPTHCTQLTCEHRCARGLVVCACCLDTDAERCAFTIRRETVEKLIAHFKLSDEDQRELWEIIGA
jgi:hypothetical protein